MATTIAWPSDLPPRFLPRSFSRQLKELSAVTQPEVGRVRVRGRSTAKIYVISGNILLSSAEVVLTLEDFYFTTLKLGSLTFNWVDPLDPDTALEMSFTEPPRSAPQGPVAYVARLRLEGYP